jgi:hypothetical protein
MTSSSVHQRVGCPTDGHWTMKILLFAAIFALAGWLWTGTARATAPPSGADLGSQIQGMVDSEIGTAMAVASSAVSEAGPVAAPMVTVTMSSPRTGDAGATADASAPIVTIDSAPSETARVAGFAKPQRVSQHRPRAQPQARGRSTVPRAQLPLKAGTGIEGGSASPAELPRISETHRAVSRPKQHAAPAPRPQLPSAPRAPGDPGALLGGQGGGQGTSPTPLPAALAGFFLVAILLLLRRVVWSAMPVPRRVALPPWRPG